MLTALAFRINEPSSILDCIPTVAYSIKINGQAKGEMKPTRGLRQGDPLYPYLFILYAEAFPSLIHAPMNENALEGIRITQHCPRILHPVFADDSLLFSKAILNEAAIYAGLMKVYCAESGQDVNLNKCCLFSSNNTATRTRANISNMLEIKNNTRPKKYLIEGGY